MRADAETPAGTPVALWDLPVRVVHWGFVICIGLLWWSGEEGNLDLHKTVGYTMLGLVVFRVLWGLVGSSTARFSRFVKGPGAILAYLRGGDGQPSVGHNPLGALSVLLLLGLLGLQVYLGLIAVDVDGIESGPLSYLVAYETSDAARGWHHLLFNVILAAAALHVAAILFYVAVKRDNLIGPMVTGKKRYAAAVSAPARAPITRAVVLAAVSWAFAWWVSKGIPIPGVTS